MKHVTVTNQPSNPVFQCMKSVINLGERFPSVQIGHGKGFGYKIILLRMFLDECDPDDVILFTDAHDVHVSGTHDDIIDRYRVFGSDIVFAAEKNCWPTKAFETQYLTHSDKYITYKYLNSGCFVGTVKALIEFLDQNFHNVSGATDDQMWYTQTYLKNQTRRSFVRLDTRCEIFQCLHLAMYDIDQTTRRNTITGTFPCVWHSNGALLEFFSTMCGLPWSPPVILEIDQQLISPEKNIVCITDQTLSIKFFKTYGFSPTIQETVHAKYPNHWILITGVPLPDQFEYRIYGRVLDTRKVYVLIDQNQVVEKFQLYFDKSKRTTDEFMRANQVDAL